MREARAAINFAQTNVKETLHVHARAARVSCKWIPSCRINILTFVTILTLSVFFQIFPCFFQRQTKNPRNKMKLLWRKLIRKTSYTRILIISRAINTWKSCEKGTRELNLTATIAVNVNRYTKLPTLSRRIAEPPNILRPFEVPASHSSIMGYIFGSPHFALSNVNVSL